MAGKAVPAVPTENSTEVAAMWRGQGLHVAAEAAGLRLPRPPQPPEPPKPVPLVPPPAPGSLVPLAGHQALLGGHLGIPCASELSFIFGGKTRAVELTPLCVLKRSHAKKREFTKHRLRLF